MDIDLTESQIAELQEFLDLAELDYTSGAEGSIYAQVYDGFMRVYYIDRKCGMEVRKIMERHYPERFRKTKGGM